MNIHNGSTAGIQLPDFTLPEPGIHIARLLTIRNSSLADWKFPPGIA